MGSAGPERILTYSAALNEALRKEMRRDPTVIVMGEDIAVWGDGGGVFGVTNRLVDEFGVERVRDTPISEEGIVAMGVGAAMAGLRPVVELMYFDFVTLAMEPLVNQAAKVRYMFGGQANVPLVVRSNIGASGGKAAQHSQSLESWLIHTPGLKVAVPATPSDAHGLLQTAIRDDGPVVFLEHKLLYFTKGAVPSDGSRIEFGQAVVRRQGADVTVVATHAMLGVAAQAASRLSAEGIELEIIDPRTLVPLDVETIVESVKRTNRLVVCHEAVERGGWAGEVAMQVMAHAFDYLDAPIVRICGANVPMPYSASLEPIAIPTAAGLISAVYGLFGRDDPIGPEPGSESLTVQLPSVTEDADTGRREDGTSEVLVPRLSDTMVSGRVLRWLKRPGDSVSSDDELVELETDKVTIAVPAGIDGVLARILVQEGEDAPVGAALAAITPVGSSQ